jgi:hypothetical protein
VSTTGRTDPRAALAALKKLALAEADALRADRDRPPYWDNTWHVLMNEAAALREQHDIRIEADSDGLLFLLLAGEPVALLTHPGLPATARAVARQEGD